ncbi:TPA: hypothetical protein VDA67_006051 [Burkholderia vietnamiensis]|nr:hypothetical protein [Burkholderia vietnamiensis]HEP6287569.1 hypothetical protein [Burkholderia vietnamiensis]HEP6310525.1 hypothetical protein [Burkholderia vietnamiensis]
MVDDEHPFPQLAVEAERVVYVAADFGETRVHEIFSNAHRVLHELPVGGAEKRGLGHVRYPSLPGDLDGQLHHRPTLYAQLLVLRRLLEFVHHLPKIYAPLQPPIDYLGRLGLSVQKGFVTPDYVIARQHVSTLSIGLWGWIIARPAGVMRRR